MSIKQPKVITALSLLVLACLAPGCQTNANRLAPSHPAAEDRTVQQSTRVNAYALLYQLLENEKDVSLLRFIKHEHQDLKALIKNIAKASDADGKQLKEFSKRDPSIILSDYRLPLAEVKTRDEIALFDRGQLLHQSGKPFELALLITQVQAVNYGRFLAQVAAENEGDPARRGALMDISAQMKSFYFQLVQMISADKE